MKIKAMRRLSPVFWSLLILVLAQVLALIVVSREDPFLESKNLELPTQPPDVVILWPQPVTAPSGEVTQVPAYSSFGPILVYFLAAVIIVGGVLFLIPVSKLTLVLRVIFTFLFAWGTFIILVFWLPLLVTSVIAVALATGWFFIRRVWLHNLVMFLAMVAVGAVFGRLISPWTAMLIVLAIAIYDFLAVRFGFMVWMTEKLSESGNLPAFIIPRSLSGWGYSLNQVDIHKLTETNPSERRYSILGGGDVGFALLLVCSAYFARGLGSAIIVAALSLVGLAGAYWIQAAFLKGKPMPAMPPIAALSLIGLLIAVGLPSF
jgi:presenilin-like A22 family membrane protease